MADVPDKLYFRIGEVAQLVGVDAHVLRYWESEFRMKPHRSSSGQRLYRKRDLSRFFRIKRLLHDEGYTIAGARRVLTKGAGSADEGVDAGRIRDALDRVQTLRDRILELRDELDPEGRF
ncbi:MAG: MerR family transcriptional regulator [Alphaproteobacteria bacterium]|nr:MerR family transcriptional regulator [Alphaproteobacteria bacterium]